jgi:uncharacterized membrane protein
MSHEAWLALHVLGVILFVGNIVVTAVWKTFADRTRRPEVVAFSQRLVTVTDIAFTATGVLLILVSGHVMADDYGGVFSGPTWLTVGWSLFIASGVIWVAVLIPVEVMQARLARAFRSEATIPDRYWRLSALWSVFGGVATALPLVERPLGSRAIEALALAAERTPVVDDLLDRLTASARAYSSRRGAGARAAERWNPA